MIVLLTIISQVWVSNFSPRNSQVCRLAIEIHSGLHLAYLNLGTIYMNHFKDYDQALNFFEKTILYGKMPFAILVHRNWPSCRPMSHQSLLIPRRFVPFDAQSQRKIWKDQRKLFNLWHSWLFQGDPFRSQQLFTVPSSREVTARRSVIIIFLISNLRMNF